jgi:hypothetical protein
MGCCWTTVGSRCPMLCLSKHCFLSRICFINEVSSGNFLRHDSHVLMASLHSLDDSMCSIRMSNEALCSTWPHCWHLLFFVTLDMMTGLGISWKSSTNCKIRCFVSCLIIMSREVGWRAKKLWVYFYGTI